MESPYLGPGSAAFAEMIQKMIKPTKNEERVTCVRFNDSSSLILNFDSDHCCPFCGRTGNFLKSSDPQFHHKKLINSEQGHEDLKGSIVNVLFSQTPLILNLPVPRGIGAPMMMHSETPSI